MKMQIVKIGRTWLVAVMMGLLGFTACNYDRQEDVAEEVREFEEFVNETEESYQNRTAEWTQEDWDEVEQAYQEHINGIERNAEFLSEDMQNKYNEVKMDYRQLRGDLTAETAEPGEMDEEPDTGRVQYVVSAIKVRYIVPEGERITSSEDIDLSSVTEQNIVQTYERFVDAVDEYKNEFTKEDWTEIELMWEALDTRKNQLEDNLSTEEQMEIAEEKVEYGAIKTAYKTTAKSEDEMKEERKEEKPMEMDEQEMPGEEMEQPEELPQEPQE